jgi:hypothetical protein
VLNVIPPQRAGDIAAKSGLKLINNRWVDVDWLTHGIDQHAGHPCARRRIFPAPTMPKSGHMANQHGKVAAAAILNLLSGAPNPTPVVMNTCYSFVDSKNVIHVASVHQYDAATKTDATGQGRRRRVGGAQRARRQGRAGLGEEHLGRHAGLTASFCTVFRRLLFALTAAEFAPWQSIRPSPGRSRISCAARRSRTIRCARSRSTSG